MKKIILMAMIAISAVCTSQIQARNASGNNAQTENTDKFYEIDITEIPQILQEGVNKAYQDCLIKSVYVSNNSTFVKYKVVLMTREQKEMKVYLFDEFTRDDKGNVVKEHSYFEGSNK